MKSLRILVFFLVSIVLAACATTPVSDHTTSENTARENKLVGVWDGTDEYGKTGSLIFESNGSADLIKEGQSAKEVIIRGQGTMTYEYGSGPDSDELNLVLTPNAGAARRLPGKVTFIDDNTIEVTLLGETLILHRQ